MLGTCSQRTVQDHKETHADSEGTVFLRWYYPSEEEEVSSVLSGKQHTKFKTIQLVPSLREFTTQLCGSRVCCGIYRGKHGMLSSEVRGIA